MATRGRPPKPKIEKLLLNDKRLSAEEKRAFAHGTHPLLKEADPRPLPVPKSLSKGAQDIWKRVVRGMPIGTYAPSDQDQIAAYCEAVATFRLATTMLSENGYITEGSQGQQVTSPWVAIQKDARNAVHILGATLFLTPTTRQAMLSQRPVEDEDDGVA